MVRLLGCCRSAKEPGSPVARRPAGAAALLRAPQTPVCDKLGAAKGGPWPTSPRISDAAPADEQLGRAAPQSSLRNAVQSYTRPSARTASVCLADVLACGSDCLTFEMTCDALCLRTMTVTYVDKSGCRKHSSKSGYNVSVSLPASCVDIEVTFSVVGGGLVHKIDRGVPGRPWVKDAAGQYVQECFFYTCNPPTHVQYFVRGPSLHSFVAEVDERRQSESLLALVSSDYLCIRAMHVAFEDVDGARQQWSGSGYDVKCHLPSEACNVEVTFSVVGGAKVSKIERRDPELPWVTDANGNRPLERFFYAKCPPCVQYTLAGPSLGTFVRKVFEQRPLKDSPSGMPPVRCGADAAALFEVAADEIPSIGGIVDLKQPHSEFLLPSEVVLFEPTEAEMTNSKTGARQIFLNTPLSEKETKALADMHHVLAKRGIGGPEGAFPRYMEPHALRMLQTCKFNASKAADMMKMVVSQRLSRLPMAEPDVEDDLKNGFIYWHGRDRKCRPCAVIRMDRLGEMAKDKERAVRMVVFALEYALRFAMVPGRVENWVVIIDMVNLLSAISPLHIGSIISTAAALGTTLERVYCGRMAWIKIINLPGGGWLNRAINGVIPAEKKDKIGFPMDFKSALAEHFELCQLEERYGGTAPDLKAAETYPYRFMPRCRGPVVSREGLQQPVAAGDEQGRLDTEDFSLHESTTLSFHEGQLWDRSSEHAEAAWSGTASLSSLTPASAAALSVQLGDTVAPCRDMKAWMAMTNPEATLYHSDAVCNGGDLLTLATTSMGSMASVTSAASSTADGRSNGTERILLDGEPCLVSL